jgi:DNA-binding MarR family transcriptional regulator
MRPVPVPAADELAPRLRLAVTRLARRLRQESDDPVSPTQFAALATIERSGPLTLGALAELEGVQPPTISAAVAKLEERGLVVRRADADDRRVARVTVSSAGTRLLAQVRTRKTAYLRRRLEALDEPDRQTLADAAEILERLL